MCVQLLFRATLRKLDLDLLKSSTNFQFQFQSRKKSRYNASIRRASFGMKVFTYFPFSGLSGVILTALVIIMYVFATPFSRRHLFNAFWNTHKLYIPTYILLLLHGSVRLVQEPHFPWYFIGPSILFTVDSMISMKRCKVKIDVTKAELLPSGK